jgi:hypothetical protein
MKKIKVIFFSTLLLFSITQILGSHIIRYFDNMNYSVETNCPAPDNKSRIITESSLEEEPTIVCYSNSKETLLLLQENLSENDIKLPIKLHYTILLPPDNF